MNEMDHIDYPLLARLYAKDLRVSYVTLSLMMGQKRYRVARVVRGQASTGKRGHMARWLLARAWQLTDAQRGMCGVPARWAKP